MATQTQAEYDKFILVTKRILKEELSTNHTKLTEYRWQIIEAYNIFVKFVTKNFFKVDRDGQEKLAAKLGAAKTKFASCLDALKCTYVLPEGLYEEIEYATIGSVPRAPSKSEIYSSKASSSKTAESDNVHEYTSEAEKEKFEREEKNRIEQERIEREARELLERQERERLQEIERQQAEKEEIERLTREAFERAEREFLKEQEREKIRKMAEELKAQKELLDIVNGQIRKPYSGDPLGLPTFLSGIEIAKDFAHTAALKLKMVTYVKGRLEGRAREIVTDDITTIDALVDILKRDIKPEHSKIIEGRIAALRYSYGKQDEFAAKTEELADALRRTLIIEGMTPEKANEMTIERTITLCKKSTHSDVVKAVLSAAVFTTPKEVVAKLITGNDECAKEKQVLRFTKNGNRGNGHGKFNNRGHGYQPNRGNFNRGGRGNFNRFNNYRGNFNNTFGSRGSYKGGRGVNFSGRGYYNNNNNRYQTPQTNNVGWQMNRGPNVRLTQTGNGSGPQAIMGGPQIQQLN